MTEPRTRPLSDYAYPWMEARSTDNPKKEAGEANAALLYDMKLRAPLFTAVLEMKLRVGPLILVVFK